MNWQHAYTALLVAGLLLACDFDAALGPGGVLPPAAALRPERPARPAVVSVSLSPNQDGAIDVVVRFSEPMRRNSVETALAVVSAEKTIFSASDGLILPVLDNFSWRSDNREVAFKVSGTNLPVVLTLAPTALGENDLALDGQVPLVEYADVGSYHRFEDDGFSGAVTYVSLPFYPSGTTTLVSHPPFLLSNQRPRLVCNDLQFATPVFSGSLGTLAADQSIACALFDASFAPERSGNVERREKRLFHPGHLPTAIFSNAASQTVAGIVGLGSGGDLPIAASLTVLGIFSRTQLSLVGLALSGNENTNHAYLLPAMATGPAIPLTGVTAPDKLNLAAILHQSTASENPQNNFELADLQGQAWLADEFAGQIFARVGGGPVSETTILSNTASNITLGQIVACGGCNYQIRTDVGGRYSVGTAVRLTSDQIRIRPQTPLAAGTWKLTIAGGRDLLGLAISDGERDGDEVNGIPDDTLVFSVNVP